MMNWLYVWYRPGRDADVDRLVHDMTTIFMRGFVGRREVRESRVPRALVGRSG